jgi:sugar O-acyltransferase (sialic acid O-acetyltransferase NeuD family)
MAQFVILGAGGLGLEVAAMLHNEGHSVYGLLGLPDEVGQQRGGWPVIASDSEAMLFTSRNFALAIGKPQIKKQVIASCPLDSTFPAFISQGAWVMDLASFQVGQGSIIAPGVTATCNILIGQWTYINLNVTIGHGVQIGDYCQINPGVNLSGNVTIGHGVLIGSNAAILENRTIGDGAIVGAGAVVTKDVPRGVTVMGVPAKAAGCTVPNGKAFMVTG